jgi:hypothetical protein
MHSVSFLDHSVNFEYLEKIKTYGENVFEIKCALRLSALRVAVIASALISST